MSSDLQQTDRDAAEVATAPRVRLADIEASIERRHDFTADQAVGAISGMAL